MEDLAGPGAGSPRSSSAPRNRSRVPHVTERLLHPTALENVRRGPRACAASGDAPPRATRSWRRLYFASASPRVTCCAPRPVGAGRQATTKNARSERSAAVCSRKLDDGITQSSLFACLRPPSNPDRRVRGRVASRSAFFRAAESGRGAQQVTRRHWYWRRARGLSRRRIFRRAEPGARSASAQLAFCLAQRYIRVQNRLPRASLWQPDDPPVSNQEN
jgi:hypothetical protein